MIAASFLQRLARPYLLILALVLLLIPILYSHSSWPSPRSLSPLAVVTQEHPRPLLTPKITVIGIWSPRDQTDPHYMPYFFQSVQQNPMVNFLFFNLNESGSGCQTHSNAPNVQEICLSRDEYYQLHVDFLCQRWRCDMSDRVFLHDFLADYLKDDLNHSFFRILRSGIFARYMDPATTIWGWCDMDEYWGSFERNFPWDVAHDFDIIAITSQPDYRFQKLLFTRGHMAFFRHSPETLRKLHSYPKFESIESFFLLPPTRQDAEESEFSHFYFGEDDSFTFIHVEGMLDSDDAHLVSSMGAYHFKLDSKTASEKPDLRKAILTAIRSRQQVDAPMTFAPGGIEQQAHVIRGNANGEMRLWFPEELAVSVETRWNATERDRKGIFMRREPGAPILQWLQHRERHFDVVEGIKLNEALYKHWQTEKRKPWFKQLPSKGLRPGETLVQFANEELQIWSEKGDILFKIEHE